MKNRNLRVIFPVWTMLALGLSAAPGIQSDAGQKTADDQKNNKEDLALTANIRKALMADKTLSTSAHNVKIITEHGMVTLRGAVKSEAERDSVVDKARGVAGATMVSDSLTVALPKTN